MQIIQLFLLIISAIVIGYKDLRYKKISNKAVIISFLLGLFLHCLYFYYKPLDSALLNYYLQLLICNVVLAAMLSVMMWFLSVWSAGDVKAFVLLSFLLPLNFYREGIFLSFFPAFNLIVDIFLFITFYIVLEMLLVLLGKVISIFLHWRVFIRQWQSSLLRWIQRSDKMHYLELIWFYLVFFVLVRILRLQIKKEITEIAPYFLSLSYLAMIAVFRPLKNIMKRWGVKFCGGATLFLGAYLLITDFNILTQLKDKFLRHFLGFALIFLMVRRLITAYAKKSKEIIDINKLEPYMVLTEGSIRKIKSFLGRHGEGETFYPDGLTPYQVNNIKKINTQTNELGVLEIYKTIPTVFFMLLAIIFAIFFQEPFLSVIIEQYQLKLWF